MPNTTIRQRLHELRERSLLCSSIHHQQTLDRQPRSQGFVLAYLLIPAASTAAGPNPTPLTGAFGVLRTSGYFGLPVIRQTGDLESSPVAEVSPMRPTYAYC